jgi:hypothetical protein
MPNISQYLFGSFDINLGKFSLPIAYWQAAAVIILLFLLVITVAQYRHHYVDYSLKGGVAGIFFGFLLALFLEGFLLIGGKTALTGLLGWKNPPVFLTRGLDAGRAKLVQVLGLTSDIPATYAYTPQAPEQTTGAVLGAEEVLPPLENALNTVQSLNPADQKTLRSIICSP